MKTTYGILFLLLLALNFTTCTADQLPEPEPSDCTGSAPTYEADIRVIIETSCAYSGCHLGDAPGLYNSYAGLLPAVEEGIFRERVINLRADPTNGMPPNYAPDDRPQELTETELMLIDCWLQGGFPE